MPTLEDIATAAVQGDALRVRSLAQEWFATSANTSAWVSPTTSDLNILAVTAAMAELFAARLRSDPPAWSQEIGAAPEALFLIKSARTMSRLRRLCETDSPSPFKKRRVYVPPNYLQFA